MSSYMLEVPDHIALFLCFQVIKDLIVSYEHLLVSFFNLAQEADAIGVLFNANQMVIHELVYLN